MMREAGIKVILFLVILLTGVVHVRAQDTLVYKSGEVQAVTIIEVDENLGIIGYVHNADTSFIDMKAISDYILHSTLGENENALDMSQTANNSPSHVKSVNIRNGRFSKYTYGRYSVGANMLAPISAVLTGTQRFWSANVSLYAEYLVNDHFALRIPVRIGKNLFLSHADSDSIPMHNLRRSDRREIILEFGFEPVFYLGGQVKYAFYLKPGIYYGFEHIRTYKYYYDFATTYGFGYSVYDVYSIGKSKGYINYAFGFGVLFNLCKALNLSTELGFGRGEKAGYITKHYEKDISSVDYVLVSQYTSNAPYNGFAASFNLVYRFGGKLRE